MKGWRLLRVTIIGIAALLVIGLAAPMTLADDDERDDDNCEKAPIIALGATPIRGKAFLCINRKGVRARLHAKGLTPGYAYTIWFIYFDDPSKCTIPGQCGAVLEDFTPGDPCSAMPPSLSMFDPVGVLGRLDSAVAPHNGKVYFSGRFGGLHLSSGSQVQLLIAEHGMASTSDNRALARQLLTPEDPSLGAPQMGNCVDGLRQIDLGAVAIFTIP